MNVFHLIYVGCYIVRATRILNNNKMKCGEAFSEADSKEALIDLEWTEIWLEREHLKFALIFQISFITDIKIYLPPT